MLLVLVLGVVEKMDSKALELYSFSSILKQDDIFIGLAINIDLISLSVYKLLLHTYSLIMCIVQL